MNAPVFCVVIHDVAPPNLKPVQTLLRALPTPLHGRVVGAVVPFWHGLAHGRIDAPFAHWLHDAFGEVLQHGHTHVQPRGGIVSRLTHHASELSGLSRQQAMHRIRQGHAALTHVMARPVHGFIPPAWQWGPLTHRQLAACGLRFGVGWSCLRDAAGRKVSLATSSWDVGLGGPAGYLAEAAGALHQWAHPEAIPCLTLHPADVHRGFLPRAIRKINALLEAGLSPVTFEALIQARMGPSGAPPCLA